MLVWAAWLRMEDGEGAARDLLGFCSHLSAAGETEPGQLLTERLSASQVTPDTESHSFGFDKVLESTVKENKMPKRLTQKLHKRGKGRLYTEH